MFTAVAADRRYSFTRRCVGPGEAMEVEVLHHSHTALKLAFLKRNSGWRLSRAQPWQRSVLNCDRHVLVIERLWLYRLLRRPGTSIVRSLLVIATTALPDVI